MTYNLTIPDNTEVSEIIKGFTLRIPVQYRGDTVYMDFSCSASGYDLRLYTASGYLREATDSFDGEVSVIADEELFIQVTEPAASIECNGVVISPAFIEYIGGTPTEHSIEISLAYPLSCSRSGDSLLIELDGDALSNEDSEESEGFAQFNGLLPSGAGNINIRSVSTEVGVKVYPGTDSVARYATRADATSPEVNEDAMELVSDDSAVSRFTGTYNITNSTGTSGFPIYVNGDNKLTVALHTKDSHLLYEYVIQSPDAELRSEATLAAPPANPVWRLNGTEVSCQLLNKAEQLEYEEYTSSCNSVPELAGKWQKLDNLYRYKGTGYSIHQSDTGLCMLVSMLNNSATILHATTLQILAESTDFIPDTLCWSVPDLLMSTLVD